MNKKIDFVVKQENGITVVAKIVAIGQLTIGKVYDPEIVCRVLVSHRKGYDCSVSIICGGEAKLHIEEINNNPYYSSITVSFHFSPAMTNKYFIINKYAMCAELMSLINIKSLYKAMHI